MILNGSQWLPWTVSKLSYKLIKTLAWSLMFHQSWKVASYCSWMSLQSCWQWLISFHFSSIMAHDNRWPDHTTVSGDIRWLRVSERLKSSNRVSTSSCLNCNVLESVHTFLVYYLPDCMTEREIHQTARMLWPRPTHHQSVRYRAGDTCSARSNIWANTARQTDPQPCTSAFVKMITHKYTHTRLWKKYVLLSWALFALRNVNISTIFTPASILPVRRFSVKDLNASQIELTWFFFFFPSYTNSI